MACPGSFPSSHADPKSGWDLDPNKPGYTTSCQGYETDPNFLCIFSGFCSPILDFCN